MNRKVIEDKRDQTLRQSQVDLYHSLQICLNEVSQEMLGETHWNIGLVDRSLQELLTEIQDHFGLKEEEYSDG